MLRGSSFPRPSRGPAVANGRAFCFWEMAMPLTDNYRRRIDYLRISVTDRCNLRCTYCIPARGIEWLPRRELLSYEEMLRLAKAALLAGIEKIRISGGEPLLKRDLPEFIFELAGIGGLKDLCLTTNGVLLAESAATLKKAGLRRVNISLDSLRPRRYREITGANALAQVWRGVEAALAAGLVPLKLNMVLLAGINAEEVLDFAALAEKFPWHIRFIELRPGSPLYPQAYLPVAEAWRRINDKYRLQAIPAPAESTARLYSFPGGRGVLGFIGRARDVLCRSCNRLRLTAQGKLYPCLFSGDGIDVGRMVKEGADEESLVECFRLAAAAKPPRMLPLKDKPSMSLLGG